VNALRRSGQGLADTSRPVVGCCMTRDTRVRYGLDDVAGKICQALVPGAGTLGHAVAIGHRRACGRVVAGVHHIRRVRRGQGLTLVHFSAQRKRFQWDRGCIQGLF
jgi:hypothetical protein